MRLCRWGRTSLVAAVLDHGQPPAWMAFHVGRCLTCQAVAAQTRQMRRHLATLPARPPLDTVPAGGLNLKLLAAGAVAMLLVLRAGAARRLVPSFLPPQFDLYSGFRRTP